MTTENKTNQKTICTECWANCELSGDRDSCIKSCRQFIADGDRLHYCIRDAEEYVLELTMGSKEDGDVMRFKTATDLITYLDFHDYWSLTKDAWGDEYGHYIQGDEYGLHFVPIWVTKNRIVSYERKVI